MLQLCSPSRNKKGAPKDAEVFADRLVYLAARSEAHPKTAMKERNRVSMAHTMKMLSDGM